MAQGYLFETMTGRIIDRFPARGSWDVKPNEPETVKLSIGLQSPREQRRGWLAIAQPWKVSAAVEIAGRYYGGPIQPKSLDDASSKLDIDVRGVGRILERFPVLPPQAETAAFFLPDGTPNPALNTILQGLDYGSIAKRLVQQYCAWDGGALPIIFPPDIAGTRRREYEAIDFKILGDAIKDLTQVMNGPDIRFVLQRRDENYFQWEYQAGTEQQPRLQSARQHYWNIAAAKPSASKLSFTTDPSAMADISISVGEISDERNVLARSVSRRLRDSGHPVMMNIDTGHSDVKEQSTAQSYAEENLRTAWAESQFWKFEASLQRGPKLQDVREGDLLLLKVANHKAIPDGEYPRRIAALSGDTSRTTFNVVCGEVFGG